MSIVEEAKAAVQELATGAMRKAVALAPDRWVPGGVPDPLIARKHGLIGAPVSRLDGPLKVRGEARFAAEFPLDGMVYAAVAHGTVARGRIARLDTAEAEAAPGVAAVMTHLNAPRMRPMPVFMSTDYAIGGMDLPVMQDDEIHWNGQPIAVVLAETQEQADHAKSLIRATYEEAPATLSLAAGKAKGARPGVLMGEPLRKEKGDAEAALAAAAVKVDGRYSTPGHNHNPIELHAATVAWVGDTLIVHDASQAVGHSAASLAHMFGIARDKVRLTSPYVGGGFGSKLLWQHQVLAAAAGKLTGRPVRIMLSREGVYRGVGGRSPTEQRVAIGADRDGRFQSIVHTGFSATTPHVDFPEAFVSPTQSAYASPNIKLDVEMVDLDTIANTFMRAPGESVGTFALESAVDELAEALGVDPVELRLRNEPAEDPTTGRPFSSRNVVEAWRAGAERFGWDDRRPAGQRREGEWLVGAGCAAGTYPYVRMGGGAARITLTSDGRAEIDIAAAEMGMGTATAQSQVSAARLGLELEEVTFNYGDSSLPGMVLAGGSQQSAAISAAVSAAHRALVAELLKLAGNDSPLAGLKPDEVGSMNGGLAKLDDEARFESYRSILERARRDSVSVEAEAPKPLELQHWSMHSWSAIFAEVRVNAVTGELRVDRLLGSYDCGRILNAKTARSQFRGGMIMGLGLAMMEATEFDERSGRIMNPSLAEYHIPVHMDVPEIDVIWTDIPDPHTPIGARGVGEIGITGTAAAVANAVYNACGVRVRDLPITLDKLLPGLPAA